MKRMMNAGLLTGITMLISLSGSQAKNQAIGKLIKISFHQLKGEKRNPMATMIPCLKMYQVLWLLR